VSERRPRQPAAATLSPSMIRRVIKGLPNDSIWRRFRARTLIPKKSSKTQRHSHRLAWDNVSKGLNNSAGVYMFLFPRRVFPRTFRFNLHGPSKKKIPFKVTMSVLPHARPRWFAAYVGRSSNLRNRLPLHFHNSKNTTAAQVRKAVEECHGLNSRAAVNFMLDHAMVYYCPMPGKRNVANRDIIEVALWAKFRTPFNIKSER
jgi:hypothetical protein